VVPCCFHRVADDRAPDVLRPPRSRLGATVDPRLDWRALRLPGRTDGCSRAARNEARVRAMAWRLALDALYDVPVGARSDRVGRTPRAWGRDGFAAWAARVAARDGLALPGFDALAAEAAGFQLLAHERRRGLARTLFRRPIALWWVLDRAQAAAEAGRAVAVGEITPAAVTPRNVALLVDPPRAP
jgi:hypothetical protein